MVDLPEPEEVFGVPHLGRKEVVRFVLGPSLIALGISIGSGEWLLGPLNVGTLGFVGVGWIITVSALLQVFYNLEFSRYVLATGEVPIVGFGRMPPGAWLWIPFSLIALFFAFIWGGWAKAAAQGLYALLYGEVPTAADTTTVTLLAILLLLVVMGITMVSRKITRGLSWPTWARSASSSCSCWSSTCSWSPSASGGTACAGCSPRPCPRAATPPCSAAWPGSPPWRPGSTGT